MRDPSPPQGQGPHSSVLPVSKYRRPLGTMCGKWVLSPWPRAERKLPGGRRRVDEVRVDAYKRPSQKSKFTLRTKAGWDLAAGFQVEFSTTPPAGGVCYNQVAWENLHQLNHLTTARALRAAAGVPAGPAPRAVAGGTPTRRARPQRPGKARAARSKAIDTTDRRR